MTVLEVLIVAALIAILAAVLIPNYLSTVQRSRQKRTMSDMRNTAQAVESYLVDHSSYPVGNDVTVLPGLLVPDYARQLVVDDAWGNAFAYTATVDLYSLESYGRDGIDGTDISAATAREYENDLILSNGNFTASPD